MATAPRFTKTVVAVPISKIADTTRTTIYAANATYDSRITGISVSTDDTAAGNAKLEIFDGTNYYPVRTTVVAAGSGVTVSVEPVGLMSIAPIVFRERDSNGVTILNLPKGNSLHVTMSACTSGKFFWVLVKAELYD